jgi:hypothetical protein
MPRYSIKQEPVLGAVGKTGKTAMPLRWIVRDSDGKQIGNFATEQEAIEFRDRDSKSSKVEEPESD